MLRTELEKIAAPKPELGNALPAGSEKGVRWTEPQLVCEVEYRGWTADKLIRQSAFKGLREDRPPEEIVLEVAPEQSTPDRGREPLRERLTHPERILWPEQGVTKEGLAEFYADIADWILPHLSGRVLSLVRCPSGRGREVLLRQACLGRPERRGAPRRRRREGEDADARQLSMD